MPYETYANDLKQMICLPLSAKWETTSSDRDNDQLCAIAFGRAL
jgi:hypothetical protein